MIGVMEQDEKFNKVKWLLLASKVFRPFIPIVFYLGTLRVKGFRNSTSFSSELRQTIIDPRDLQKCQANI